MRNPDKNRFLKAARHIETEEIPLFECDPDMSIVNKMLDKNFELALHDYELPIADQIEWSLVCAVHNLLKLWRSGKACWI